MSGLVPWTKFQDFYLRLGFLKALVAVLGAERRSVPTEAIVRRARSPLLDPLEEVPCLEARTRGQMTWWADREKKGGPSIAEALVLDADLPSLLFAITRKTTYKILDWGRDVGLSGRGNQISERGVILRSLMDTRSADAFLAGKIDAWNPFVLSQAERLFFLFHLLEIDRVTAKIIDAVGSAGTAEALEIGPASRILALALRETLAEIGKDLRPSDIPAFRTASDLAATIALETGLEDSGAGPLARPGPPKPTSPATLRKTLVGRGSREPRRRTKNADHQTVPRFEQLCDLGFFEKPGETDDLAARKRWRWRATDVAVRWARARRCLDLPEDRFLIEGFARSALHAFTEVPVAGRCTDTALIARYLEQGYRSVRRPFGHTPLDSAALVASFRAIEDGIAIEPADFHRLMSTIKARGYLEGEVFFASGNAYDKMFVLLRGDFAMRVAETMPRELAVSEIEEERRQ